jgi:hypothetical protein
MFGSLLCALMLAAAAGPPAELTDRTYDQWRDHVRPKAKELCFCTVPWRSTFWDAVVEAQKQDKPILLWAMNGHPLACT